MINHVRTLLLNRPASYTAGLLNNEYIPETYTPLVLSPSLTAIRNAIIPVTGSKQQEVDVVNIVMQVLHSPDLEPYTLKFDPRITYGAHQVIPARLASKHVDMAFANVTEDCDVVPHYEYTVNSTLEPLAGVYTWSVSSVDAHNVKVTNTKGMASIVRLNLNSSSLTSASIDIIPGYLSIYFDLPSLYFTGVFTVKYSLTVAASYDLVKSAAALRQSLIADTGVFQYDADQKDVTTLRDTWLHNPAFVTQFGAGVLAYIYKLEGLRQ